MDVEALSLPALLRGAQGAYAAEVRRSLLEAGFDDLPRNGPFVLAVVALAGASLSELGVWLRISKQAAGQLIDTLVVRAYLDRSVDPVDRRRLRVALSERGLAAAAVVRAAVDEVDARLVSRMGADAVAVTRTTLAALLPGAAGVDA